MAFGTSPPRPRARQAILIWLYQAPCYRPSTLRGGLPLISLAASSSRLPVPSCAPWLHHRRIATSPPFCMYWYPFLSQKLCLSPSIWLPPSAGTGAPRLLYPPLAPLLGTHRQGGRALEGGAAPCLASRKPAARSAGGDVAARSPRAGESFGAASLLRRSFCGSSHGPGTELLHDSRLS